MPIFQILKLLFYCVIPTDRAYSHFIMSQRDGLEPVRSFDEIVRKEIEEVPALLQAHQRGFLDADYCSRLHCKTPDGLLISVAEHNQDWTPRPLRTEEDLFRFYYMSYVFRSLYYDQLWRWIQLYPRGQMMIIQAEKFFSMPKSIMSEVAEFLGLQAFDFNAEELNHTWGGGASNEFKNPGSYVSMKEETRNLLNEFFAPFNEKLYSLIGENYHW